MCGITGKFNYQTNAPVHSELISKMNDELRHRGPDDDGVYVNGNIGIGQARLSINDLRSDASPPLTNENGTIWLVFNGEIYNFKALRAELIQKGHEFKTLTDSEVVLHAYEEYGHGCLEYFNGMFAFALWDAKRKELFCARDRLGKKPFCYSCDSGSFRFGSEIKAITVDPEFQVAADYGALNVYLRYGYIPSPLSAFKGIHKLQPGHFLICESDGNVKIKRYWSPPVYQGNSMATINEIKEELKSRLREAVRLRMISDVPLGAFLSGGLDSTTIVALMAQESAQPIKTFSIGFKDDAFNELPYARLLAERYGTEHHEFIVQPDAAEVLPHLVRHYNEPFADSSAIPTYYVSKLTREHVTVALSGDGGDECYAGYERYGVMSKWNLSSRCLKPVRPLLNIAEKCLKNRTNSNSQARISRGLHMLGHDLSDQYRLQMTAGLKPQEKHELFTNDFFEQIALHKVVDPIGEFSKLPCINTVEYCMFHDQNFYLPDALMVKSDIASMANSLELRAPLLDYQMVEFASTIPMKYKLRDGLGKWIFRETFGEMLPQEILNKPKSGFALPLGKWFRGDLSYMLHDVLLDSKARSRGLFDYKKMEQMVDEHKRQVRPWGNRLWTLLVLELWFREFID